MNKKDVKAHASTVADSIVKKGKVKPEKLEVNFLGIEKNEKGNFHSILLEVDIVVAGDGGKLNTLKNIQLPLNYMEDIVIDAVEKAKAEAKAIAEKAKADKEAEKNKKEEGKKAFNDAQPKIDAKPVVGTKTVPTPEQK